MLIFFKLGFFLALLVNCQKQNVKTACPQDIVAVCGQPNMRACPKGQVCPMAMPLPKTYGNICLLNKAKATFISNGPCPQF